MSKKKSHVYDDDDAADSVRAFEEEEETQFKYRSHGQESKQSEIGGFDNLDHMASIDAAFACSIGSGDGNDFLWDKAVMEDKLKNKQAANKTNNRTIVRGFSMYESDDEEDDDGSNRVSIYCDPCNVEDDDDFDDGFSDDDINEYSTRSNCSKATLTTSGAGIIKQQLKSFIPDIITAIPDAKTLSSIHFKGYFLLADISGFTKLSSTLCAQGSKGLDKLRSITHNSFRSFIDIILIHGGDVIAFAGDALICVFRPPSNDDITSNSNSPKSTDNCDSNAENIGHCGLSAIACAKEICDTLLNGVQIHCGITYGHMNAAILGGYRKMFAMLLNGKCTEEIGQVLDSAGPNEVVVSHTVYNLVSQYLNDGGDTGTTYTTSHDNNGKKSFETNTNSLKFVESLTSLDGKALLFKILVKPSFVSELAGINQTITSFGKKETRNHTSAKKTLIQVRSLYYNHSIICSF
jgi:class 3 adenylate cyclase